jgi:hypothetical protein
MRLLVVGLLGLVACGDDASSVDHDAGPDAAPRGQGSEAASDLLINEVAPRGPGTDWVELLNRGAEPIDLCGYVLTDAVDRLDNYLPLGGVMPPDACTPSLLAPGERLIISTDGTPIVAGVPIDPTHAPFSLGVADEIHLLATDGLVIDGLLYLYGPGPESSGEDTLSRDPDGNGLFFERAATPGDANPSELP